MEQYFHVGEEVILCSGEYPEHNGNRTIKGIVGEYETVMSSCGGGSYITLDGIGYILDGNLTEGYEGYTYEIVFHQSALRKKPKPSEDSFEEIMSQCLVGEVKLVEED